MSANATTLRIAALALVALAASPACFAKKKKGPPPPPPVGWQKEATWSFDCYYPPDFSKLDEMSRRKARGEALNEMLKQWKGEHTDGLSLPETPAESVENILLGRPEAIEGVARQNLDQCKIAATGGSKEAWGEWLRSLSAKLNSGQCVSPFNYTMFDYLDIGQSWQRILPICKGDTVRVTGTVSDKYRLAPDGPWITVEGDKDKPTLGSATLPCNLEGCYQGILVLRFVSPEGVEVIKPVGSKLVFVAPEHGEISYRINDDTLYDNVWFKSGSIEDHTAIEISPSSGIGD